MLPLTRTRTLLVSSPETSHPTTPHTQPLPGLTRTWFSLIHVRSPLLAESQLFSSPTGTEMFHFPASTSTQTMHSSAGNTTQPVLGSPIRTSSDQRFVDNSPRHNAASHVLHRLSMPRHPPYALNNQTIIQHTQTHTTTQRAAHAQIHKTQKQSCKLTKQKILHNTTPQAHTNMRTRMRQRRKMLASTIQFSHNTPTPQQPHTTNSAVIIHVQANKTTTTTHNANAVRRPCAAPDTQQHANIPKTMFAEHWSHTHAAQSRSIQPCRCASTRNLYKTKKWQSHLRRHQPPTHNRGHKNKSSLERR